MQSSKVFRMTKQVSIELKEKEKTELQTQKSGGATLLLSEIRKVC
jgi:hypothetical protein